MHVPSMGLIAAVAVAVCVGPASAADLKIFGSRVTKVMVEEMKAEIVEKTGLNPVVTADVAAVMMRRIEQDEAFDAAVLVNFQIDGLIKKGKLAADSRVDLMRSGIGIAVKRGAPKPDVSTVAALKKALLDAKSITYLKEGASTITIERLIKEWGMVDALAGKTIKTDGEQVSEFVAEGKVELGIIVIPNIMSVPGAEVAGAFPDEIQQWVVFTGAVGEKTANKQAARTLLAILKSPRGNKIMKEKGLDPM